MVPSPGFEYQPRFLFSFFFGLHRGILLFLVAITGRPRTRSENSLGTKSAKLLFLFLRKDKSRRNEMSKAILCVEIPSQNYLVGKPIASLHLSNFFERVPQKQKIPMRDGTNLH